MIPRRGWDSWENCHTCGPKKKVHIQAIHPPAFRPGKEELGADMAGLLDAREHGRGSGTVRKVRGILWKQYFPGRPLVPFHQCSIITLLDTSLDLPSHPFLILVSLALRVVFDSLLFCVSLYVSPAFPFAVAFAQVVDKNTSQRSLLVSVTCAT